MTPWLLYALAAMLVLDAWRLRTRVSELTRLAAVSAEPGAETASASVTGSASDSASVTATATASASGFATAPPHLLCAPGVTITAATIRAATAYLRAHHLASLDIVPADLPTIRALTLAQLVDPPAYRAARFGAGRTAGHALLVTADAAARADISTAPPATALDLVRAAVKLKDYGPADIAIAPDERTDTGTSVADGEPRERYDTLRAMMGPSANVALAALPILLALIALGIWAAPLPGLVALAAWQLQPLLAFAGTQLSPRDLLITALLRAPLELVLFIRTFTARPAPPMRDHIDRYAQLAAAGTDAFFEPRRATCPLCDSPELATHLRTADMFQHKPGTFTLERCRGCRHIFQNPRLSLAGLDYYYKDFYDGLGEAGMEMVFGFSAQPYHTRAQMLRAHGEPKRWLDVGAGHGHFCVAAREDLPQTTFDGLDLSESIEIAKRRGWVDTAYRGLFPELAPRFAGAYDAVSMSHYLEHTLDPRAEIAAAATALAPAGCLLIEVPDPDFKLGHALGRFWLPWFQPQHLNLLSVKNLERILREHHFEPLVWHRGEAHQRVDLFFASWLLLDRIAPSASLPWRPRGAVASAWRVAVWTLGMPLVALGVAFDNLAGIAFSRARVSNTYRVVARKQP